MKMFSFCIIMLLSFPALACWKLTGSFEVNGKTLMIDQKISHDKTYSFQHEKFIAHVKVPAKFEIPKEIENKKDAQLIQIELIEKNGVHLKTLAKPQVFVRGENEATMTQENNQTKDFTKITLKLEKI